MTVADVPTRDSTRTRHAHRLDLQGVRGLAVGLVLAAHAAVPFFQGGFIGVDVFFVLSGYLITALLLRDFERYGRIRFAVFYTRRFRRLLPSATLVLVATTVAGVLIVGFDASKDLLVSALWTVVFLGNFGLIATGADYFATDGLPSPFQQYWSLAVEEQYYLLWPVLLLAALLLGARILKPLTGALIVTGIFTVGSFVFSWYQTTADPTVAYYSPLTRAWELGAGSLLAIAAIYLPTFGVTWARIMQLTGVVIIMMGAILITPQTPFPGTAAIAPVVGTLLIIAAGVKRPTLRGPLTQPVLVWLGDISYALYLWHWPLLILPIYVTGEMPSLTQSLLLVAIAVLLAEVTTRWFENPIRFNTMLAKNTKAAFASAAVLVLLPAAVLSTALIRSDSRTPAVVEAAAPDVVKKVTQASRPVDQAVAITDQTRPKLSDLEDDSGEHVAEFCLSQTDSEAVQSCTFGDPDGKRHVIVFGDSHAGMWTPGLDLWGKQSSTRITLIAKTACSPWKLDIWHRGHQKPHITCNPWREAALNSIIETKSDLVLVAGNANNMNLTVNDERITDTDVVNAAWPDAVTSTLSTLTAAGKNVAILTGVPAFADDILNCLSRNRDDARACEEVRDLATYRYRIDVEREAARASDAGVVNTTSWFCQGDTCPVIINDIIVYRDRGGHLTATFSSWLGSALGQRVERHMKSEAKI